MDSVTKAIELLEKALDFTQPHEKNRHISSALSLLRQAAEGDVGKLANFLQAWATAFGGTEDPACGATSKGFHQAAAKLEELEAKKDESCRPEFERQCKEMRKRITPAPPKYED
jgi:hypothetical protein